jgi:RNA polymerase sigma-70 factor (ECF subfamily)
MRDRQDDARLLERLKAHADGAPAELTAAYGSKIYQLALRYLRNREDAEEITQDVLLKVCRNAEAFRGDAALSSWIYRITFNAAMSRLRASRHRSTRSDEPAAWSTDLQDDRAIPEPLVADWSQMADERIMRQQLRQRLFKALRELPLIYRQPVLLRDIQGMSTEEASAVLQVKDQTLKSRLHRGRLILRRQLADFASGLALHHAPA